MKEQMRWIILHSQDFNIDRRILVTNSTKRVQNLNSNKITTILHINMEGANEVDIHSMNYKHGLLSSQYSRTLDYIYWWVCNSSMFRVYFPYHFWEFHINLHVKLIKFTLTWFCRICDGKQSIWARNEQYGYKKKSKWASHNMRSDSWFFFYVD